ncbi:MAG: flagellar biosynthetic protein FliO [Acidobacteria bacterium]|nr:flagellar biosynthetic protein FliO [Acidobacteriota bacterium]
MVLAQTVLPGSDPVPISGQAMAAVLVVLVLLVAVSWLLRRGTLVRRSKQAVTVETAVALGDRRSLVIVAVEGRRLLVGLTPGQISLVTELQPPFASALEASVEKGAPS